MFRIKDCVVTATGDITFADRHSLWEFVVAVESLQQIWSFGKRSAPELRRDFRVEPLMQHPHASPFVKVLQGGKAVAMAEEWVLVFQEPNAAFRVGLASHSCGCWSSVGRRRTISCRNGSRSERASNHPANAQGTCRVVCLCSLAHCNVLDLVVLQTPVPVEP